MCSSSPPRLNADADLAVGNPVAKADVHAASLAFLCAVRTIGGRHGIVNSIANRSHSCYLGTPVWYCLSEHSDFVPITGDLLWRHAEKQSLPYLP